MSTTTTPSSPSTTPRPLGTTYSKNGYHYKQVIRDGDIAIFRQQSRSGVGCLAYEVIRIRVKPEIEIMGKVTPEREVAPANEEWGLMGWTYPTLERAKAKMRELTDKRDA